jgi:hypothetical protein
VEYRQGGTDARLKGRSLALYKRNELLIIVTLALGAWAIVYGLILLMGG